MNSIGMELKIILLVLYKAPHFGNSYDLRRVLNLNTFGMYNYSSFLDKLVDLKYVSHSERLQNGTSDFLITSEGKAFLKDNYADSIDQIRKAFPDQKEFLDILIDR